LPGKGAAIFFFSHIGCREPKKVKKHCSKGLFTGDILTDNIAIKRYCDKKILRKKDIAKKRYF